MDLLEYQAKALFQQMGIPVLPSQRIDCPQDLKHLKIPFPVVLKSQVPVGGRGKAGGIKFVQNTIDAVAAAQAIFHLPIRDEYPEVLLAESKYNADREFYLAIVLDRASRRPLLLGSQQGGIHADLARDQVQRVVVYEKFSPFYARRLAVRMGLQGDIISIVSAIVEKMYRLFVLKDLDLIEINPLGIRETGEVMALDGKVTVNDNALGRHPDLLEPLADGKRHKPVEVRPYGYLPPVERPSAELSVRDTLRNRRWGDDNFGELDGNIAAICNGAGLTLATLDMLVKAGGRVASFLNVGGEIRCTLDPGEFRNCLGQGLDRVTGNPKTKVLLIDLVGSAAPCGEMAATIAEFYQRQSKKSSLPKLVVRLFGRELDRAKEQLEEIEATWAESLDDAIAKAVKLAGGK